MKRIFQIAALLLSLACLLSCAGSEKKPPPSDAELLQQAQEAMAAEKYEKAQELLKRLMAEHPASESIPKAQLLLGRAYYEEKKYVEAKAEYQKFLDLHPQHPNADEGHYYLGLTHFAEIDTIDRDQAPAQRALTEFQTVLRETPDSRFAGDAQEKIGTCREKMAGHEFFIGRFYFRRKRYEAASNRFKYVLSHYPGMKMEEQTLYYLGESLLRLQDEEAATSAFQLLLEKYPDSKYGKKVRERLADLQGR